MASINQFKVQELDFSIWGGSDLVIQVKGIEELENLGRMEAIVAHENDLNLKATELRLGLPGTDESEKESASCTKNNKRSLPECAEESAKNDDLDAQHGDCEAAPAAK